MKNSDTSPARELPFRSLVAFEATARLGSVSRAAEALHLTQSAVSQRVLKLEAFVGQRLFLRQGHGVKLTGAGELLLRTVRETLERLDTGLLRIEPYRSKASLLLACPAEFAQGWLLPRLPALRALHAGVEVWLMPERELSAIDRIDVDLIVARRPLHGADVECIPFLEDRAVALCGAGLAGRLAARPWPRVLQDAPLLFVESEPEWGGLLAGRSARGTHRAATIQDERLVLAAAERDLGIAYLSQLLADDAFAQGRCHRLDQVPATPRPGLWLMRSRLTPRSAVVNRAFDWLLEQAAAFSGRAAPPIARARSRRAAAPKRG
ncbi:MAG: LysR family transcriptional regulator [Burkholderiales bacterium]|nr:LysR family transcriptional regulator [Burkholderiales bacterium]